MRKDNATFSGKSALAVTLNGELADIVRYAASAATSTQSAAPRDRRHHEDLHGARPVERRRADSPQHPIDLFEDIADPRDSPLLTPLSRKPISA